MAYHMVISEAQIKCRKQIIRQNMTNSPAVSGFSTSSINTQYSCAKRNFLPSEKQREGEGEGLVPHAPHLCQMCGVCFTRGRLAQSATVTERHTPLISFLWDAWMPLCFKSPPSPLSSTRLSSSPPFSHHSINPPICYAVNRRLFYSSTLF